MFLMILVAGGIVLAVVLGALSTPFSAERPGWCEDLGDDQNDGFRPMEQEA